MDKVDLTIKISVATVNKFRSLSKLGVGLDVIDDAISSSVNSAMDSLLLRAASGESLSSIKYPTEKRADPQEPSNSLTESTQFDDYQDEDDFNFDITEISSGLGDKEDSEEHHAKVSNGLTDEMIEEDMSEGASPSPDTESLDANEAFSQELGIPIPVEYEPSPQERRRKRLSELRAKGSGKGTVQTFEGSERSVF